MAKRISGNGKVIHGNTAGDVIFAYGLGDTIYGGPGNSYIVALGNATIFGGGGNDYISVARDTNTINGGGGNDIILAGLGNDTIIHSLTQNLNDRGGQGYGYYDGGGGFNTLELLVTHAQDSVTLQRALAAFAVSNKNTLFDFRPYHILGLNIEAKHINQITTQFTDAAPAPQNHAPTNITLSNAVVAENTLVPSSGLKIGDIVITDPDTNLAFKNNDLSLSGADAGKFHIANGALYLNAGQNLNFEGQSSYALNIIAKDQTNSALSFTKTFTINVTDVNEAPTNITLSNAVVAENVPAGTVIGTLSDTDPDTNPAFKTANYSLVSGYGDDAAFAIVGNQLKINDSPNFEAKSSYAIKVHVNDGTAGFDKVFTIGITNVNEAPTAVNDILNQNGDPQAQEDGPAITILASRLLANDTDPDVGDTNQIVSITNSAAGAHVSLDAAGNVIYNPGTLFQSLGVGKTTTDTFQYTMQDSGGLQSTATVTVIINGTNDAPVAVNDTQSGAEDTAITGNVLMNDTDIDGDALSVTGFKIADLQSIFPPSIELPVEKTLKDFFSIIGLSQGAAVAILQSIHISDFILHADGSYTLTPAPNYNGPISQITYSVSDGHGGTASGNLNITVTPVNDAPTLSVNLTTAQLDDTIGAPISDSTSNPIQFTVTDPDPGDTHHYVITNASGVIDNRFEIVNDQLKLKSGVSLDYEDPSISNHTLILNVTALDSQNAVSNVQKITLQITDQSSDTITSSGIPVANITVNEGSAFTTQDLSLANVVTHGDPDDPLSFALLEQSGGSSDFTAWQPIPGITFNTSTGVFSGIPQDKQVGVTNFEIKVTTSDGHTATSNPFTVTVVDVIDSITVSSQTTNQSTTEGTSITPFSVASAFSQADTDDGLLYSATGLPNGLSIDSNTGLISGTPTDLNGNEVTGSYSVTVTAQNAVEGATGAKASEAFTITVNDSVPVGIPIPTQSATVGDTFSINAADFFTDSDNDLTYTLSASIQGRLITFLPVSVSGSTFSLNPVSASLTNNIYTLKASDPSGNSASESFRLTLNPASTPISVPDHFSTTNSSINFSSNDLILNNTLFFNDLNPDGSLITTTSGATIASVSTPTITLPSEYTSTIGSFSVTAMTSNDITAELKTANLFLSPGITVFAGYDIKGTGNLDNEFVLTGTTHNQDAYLFVLSDGTVDLIKNNAFEFLSPPINPNPNQLISGKTITLTFNYAIQENNVLSPAVSDTINVVGPNASTSNNVVFVATSTDTVLTSGPGNDLLVGQSGVQDTFVYNFSASSLGHDKILNFNAGNVLDQIDFQNLKDSNGDGMITIFDLIGLTDVANNGSGGAKIEMFSDIAHTTLIGTIDLGSSVLYTGPVGGSNSITSYNYTFTNPFQARTSNFITIDNNHAPTIVNPIPNQSGAPNCTITVNLANVFSDVDVGDVLSYTVRLVSNGLGIGIFVKTSPLLTLTFPPVGLTRAYTYEIMATDSHGASVIDSVTLTLTPPTVTLLSSQSAIVGDSVTLTSTVTDPNNDLLIYQWTQNGTIIQGFTSSSLTFSNVSTANAGTYTLRVHDTVTGLYATSNGETLSVTAPSFPAPLLAHQTPDQNVIVGKTETLNLLGIFSFTDPAGVKYSINWGDGNISQATSGTTTSASHTYTTSGAYTVTLTATDVSDSNQQTNETFTINALIPSNYLFDHNVADPSNKFLSDTTTSLPLVQALTTPVQIINMPDASLTTLGHDLLFGAAFQFSLIEGGMTFGKGMYTNISPSIITTIPFEVMAYGANTFTSYNVVLGTSNADSINLLNSKTNNLIFTLGGDDTITGSHLGDNYIVAGTGKDTITGGIGHQNTVSYQWDISDVTVTLGTSGSASGTGIVDKLSNIQNVVGGLGNDTITGDGNNNILEGGPGTNTLTGGGGSDTFIYNFSTLNSSGPANDTIKDFGPNAVNYTLQFQHVMDVVHTDGTSGPDGVIDTHDLLALTDVVNDGSGNAKIEMFSSTTHDPAHLIGTIDLIAITYTGAALANYSSLHTTIV
ncbi:putative bacterial Ig, PKD and cadherin-like domain protein [Candidatus Bealeia paramacronuclearis]|uniref:Ig-like domain-containing protein n=1 Tax=Candidatus Bealeia paramacronuclearis TaxID=1921001 RepID=UPI002CE17EAB|nr:putative bacterial Ig, PKD and cadherin-like domain protein [Candidatus Bealeia paramacronuclearis]